MLLIGCRRREKYFRGILGKNILEEEVLWFCYMWFCDDIILRRRYLVRSDYCVLEYEFRKRLG